MEKPYRITEKYLLVPVQAGGENRRLEIFLVEGAARRKLFEFQIPIRSQITGGERFEADYFVPLPVEDWRDKELVLTGDFPEGFFRAAAQKEDAGSGYVSAVNAVERPVLHFTPETGWINDPNGLVCLDGLYHLYFQYNPFDVRWENMCWGHAVSRDLLHWEQQDTALFPDENGTMFSGSGIVNHQGLLGLPRDALLFFYTAAGDNNLWSQGKPFTQRVAYSLDGGRTLRKTEGGTVGAICRENRDPKVFWHQESQSYIMVLWLEENDFGILRSRELCRWTMSQRLTLEGAWECPDLVRVRSERDEQESAWVFLTADGFYYWGDFDGYRFRTDGVRHTAYLNSVPYAAQTYSNLEDRTVFVPWLRLPNRDRLYTGAMGLPRELRLVYREGERRLRLLPVREYVQTRREILPGAHERNRKESPASDGCLYHGGSGRALELELQLSGTGQPVRFLANGTEIRIDPSEGLLQVGGESSRLSPGAWDFSFLIDDRILEVTADYGTMIGVYELARSGAEIYMDALAGEIRLYEFIKA